MNTDDTQQWIRTVTTCCQDYSVAKCQKEFYMTEWNQISIFLKTWLIEVY